MTLKKFIKSIYNIKELNFTKVLHPLKRLYNMYDNNMARKIIKNCLKINWIHTLAHLT